MLLRALGILVLFTGVAAAQTPAERTSRAPNRDLRADRTRGAVRTPPVERASNDLRTDRARGAVQSPAERASRNLNQETREDRFRDAARDARGDARPTATPGVQQFDTQRRTLQPDVGRPEEDGRTPTGSASGTLPSMGPNPQR
jgi:hypothetical protein